MPDTRSPEQRRRIMQAVKGKNTKPEWIVRRLLHRIGYRYRLHVKNLPGRPDIVFSRRKKAIFVHGCFWHAHGCRIGRPPKTRTAYWLPKLDENNRRDTSKQEQLRARGWSILVVWQCETKDLASLEFRLKEFLGHPRFSAENLIGRLEK